MRAVVGLLILAAASACTGSATPETTRSSLSEAPPPSIVTDRLLTELDLEGLAAPTSRLRELEFLKPVPVQIIEDAEYQARVAELRVPPLIPAVHSGWLRLLGVLPAEADTSSVISRLLQTSVAAYDDEAERILVRASAGVDPYVESVVVHELVHALQRQHFGQAETPLLEGDLGYVYSALVEGDAQRVARRFIGELSPADEFAYEEGRLAAAETGAAIRDSTPYFIADSLSQPADDGVRFLQGRDYETVNGYFADLVELTSLPPSSEALIFPEANLGVRQVELDPPVVPSYEQVSFAGTLGVGRLRLLIGLGLDDEITTGAVGGWAGDRLEVRASGEDVIFTYLFAGEAAEDADELATAFRSLLQVSLAPDAYGLVRVENDQVLVVAASDRSVSERLEDAYQGFGEQVFSSQQS